MSIAGAEELRPETDGGQRPPSRTATGGRSHAQKAAGGRSHVASPARLALAIGALAAAALLFPRWMLLLAPLILGVPHVAADLRWLWIRLPGGLARGVAIAILVPLCVLLLRRAGLAAGLLPRSSGAATIEVCLGLAAVAGAALLTPATARRRAIVLPPIAIAGTVAALHPATATLVLGHLHNAIAIAFLVAFSARAWPSRSRVAVVVAFVAGAMFLSSDAAVAVATDAWLDRTAPEAFDWESLAAALAPGVESSLALRLVVVFAFAQAVHYLAWIRWTPQVAAASRRSLRDDFGALGAAAIVVLAIAVPAAAAFDPIGARTTYLSLVFFHGWLELAVATHLVLRPRGLSAVTG